MNKIKYVLLLWLTMCAGEAMAAESQRIDEIIQAARSLQLSSDPGWLQLLHYRRHVFGTTYSQADDARFFLSGDGKFDADAELEASLRGFFLVTGENTRQHAQCRFPARLHWLDARLRFRAQLPAVNCEQLDAWYQRLRASGVTLVFPAMYLNNPASMFGHTFLRLDSGDTSPLLTYTLSYGADYDPGDNALLYAWRGLSGAYAGKFSVQPYYETVQAYGDIEHRDIWEYRLDLDLSQVEQLLRHAWEIKDIRFDYYFLRENCSYRLLSLLDVARGDVPPANEHPLYAIPVDTVRSLDKRHMISSSVYRPALDARLEQMYRQLAEQQQDYVMSLIHRRTSEIDMEKYSPLEAARMLDFMIEYQSRQGDAGGLAEQLLLQRSRIKLDSQQQTFLFKAEDPRQGHPSARWQLGGGVNDHVTYSTLGFRFAFHDLLDKPDGFVSGAAISVLDTRLRYYEDEQLRLDSLVFFRLRSLNKITAWRRSPSMEFEFVMENDLRRNDNVYALSGGLGYTLGGNSGLLYAMVNVTADNYQTMQSSASLYAGAKLGMLWWMRSSARLGVEALSSRAVNNADIELQKYTMQFQYDVDAANALRLSAFSTKRFDYKSDGYELSFAHYF